jgi:hypothetical protein
MQLTQKQSLLHPTKKRCLSLPPRKAMTLCLWRGCYNYYYYYGSTAICWALAAFSVSWSHTQPIELLGRGSARRKGCYKQSKNANSLQKDILMKMNPTLSFLQTITTNLTFLLDQKIIRPMMRPVCFATVFPPKTIKESFGQVPCVQSVGTWWLHHGEND